MKIQALSHYDGDLDTRFGDCILIQDSNSLIVYDGGHQKHAEEVERFLKDHPSITTVRIVVSHNDSDHTDGVCNLLDWLHNQGTYSVIVYSHQYLRHTETILKKLDDGRRKRERLVEAILDIFDNLKQIIETADKYGFTTVEALKDKAVGSCTIVGPTVDQFTDCATKAVDKKADGDTGEETEMNAASVQLKCRLDNGNAVLLCGDAAPSFLNNLESYLYIQLPHHGQLDDAKALFDMLEDPQKKEYLVSDNTGSGSTSGGSDKLVEYMRENKFSPAHNTKDGVVYIPALSPSRSSRGKQGVILGDLDRFFRF